MNSDDPIRSLIPQTETYSAYQIEMGVHTHMPQPYGETVFWMESHNHGSFSFMQGRVIARDLDHVHVMPNFSVTRASRWLEAREVGSSEREAMSQERRLIMELPPEQLISRYDLDPAETEAFPSSWAVEPMRVEVLNLLADFARKHFGDEGDETSDDQHLEIPE